jgi:UDP-glucose 4-epimerase
MTGGLGIGSQKIATVTGSSGVIGPILIDHLRSQGYRVRAVDLISPEGASLPKDVTFYACDLAHAARLHKALAGSDIVFHLAAKLHISNPTGVDRDDYRKMNVDGTRNLVEAANRAGVKRLVFFSTINVYGSTEPGAVCDERSPTRPDSWYAESKLEGEDIVLSGSSSVVLRLAAVYGPRMKGNYPRLLRALQRGRFVMVGDGGNRRTLVHLQDVCDAAILLAEHAKALGHIYNVTDGRIYTLKEVIEAICGALERKAPAFYLPVGLTRPAFGLIEDGFHLLGRKPPLGRSTIDKFVEDMAVSGDKIQVELGFQPKVDLISGWRDVVGKMRA